MEQGNNTIAYRKLIAWQKADELAFQIYQATKNFPPEEKFGLVSQMRRASLSVAANIAEGYTRKSKKDKVHFYNIAQGSLTEIEYYLDFSRRLGYLPEDKYQELIRLRSEAGRLLVGLSRNTSAKWIATLFLVPGLLFLISITPVFAAELSFEPVRQEVRVDQQFQVDFVLDTENKSINAFEGEVIFPRNLLELKEISDGNTIVNFWIERPQQRQGAGDKEQGEIVFSGVTPGGFSSEKGLIFSMVFQVKNEGEGFIEIHNPKVLLNDGQGTPTDVGISNFQFVAIHEPIRDDLWVPPKDTDPPESFAPKIASDPNIFDGKWFVVFATQDKASGIDRYEIQENRRQKIENRNWIIAESPHVLTDQELRSFVFVKAVDRAGNERVAVVEPRYPMRWYEKWEIWVMIIIVAAIIFAIVFFWRRRKHRQAGFL